MKKNTVTVLVAGSVLAATLAGCSGKDDNPKDDPSEDATTSEGVDPDKVSPTDLPPFPTLKKKQGGAIGDLELGDCATDAGMQRVSGTLTSSQKKAADFLVTVSWTTSGNDVMGLGWKFLRNVAPGDSVEFTIKAKVADGASQCVSGVEYGKA